MRLDALLLFSSSQAVTADAASTNIVNLQNARDIGVGGGLEVFVHVATAFATTNAGELTIRFQGSTDNSTWTTYMQGHTYTAADLTASRQLGFPVPSRMGNAMPQYVRLYYEVTNAFTGGAITAGIVLDRHAADQYSPGITISN